MQFGTAKCNSISTSSKHTKTKSTYKLHNHILQQVDSNRYLGLTLQSHLKQDTHINNITSYTNKSPQDSYSSQHMNEHTHKVIVRPKLEYCFSIWDPHNTH
ncbi:hypothetical protein KP79_PYT26146 [Mizuhopecten yessoensis]|uniref:Uncharacterized protein n=1 Tax=Mizuhopecten yessoensis TaxID=6573 RepID=A0A210QGK1_MIZYE|nr:hypothetical protein KP79_PYT26146 [Mizuhopecten yessoensis]